ncbi:MAG: FAD-binding protein [Acidimicrobiia bacterium]
MSIRAVRTEVASRALLGEGVETLHPSSIDEMAETLAEATAKKRHTLIWGGGTHQGIGYRVDPDLVIFTDHLARVIDWEPDDLTVVVEGGVKIADLEALLATRGQTAVLPEDPGGGTVGGMMAAGVSGFRRARYGPTRDRILEVQVVTGDGRIVKGGGRVVKNVTGYDLPRVVVGSFGSLGVIVSCCLKLWPTPRSTATLTIEPGRLVDVHRPLAVLSDRSSTKIYLGGTEAEVGNQVTRLGGETQNELVWPAVPYRTWAFSLRVPPQTAAGLIAGMPADADFIHQVGIGEITIAAPSSDGMAMLRSKAEAVGGALIVTRAADDGFDPWGTPPPTLDLQRKLIAAFDPQRVINPGRLPGRI